MLIDAHCHFFTKNILTQSLTKLDNAAIRMDKMAKKRIEKGSGKSGVKQLGANTLDFMQIAYSYTPVEMYEMMAEKYGQEFIAVPLMLDLSYAFISPDETIAANKKKITKSLKDLAEKTREEGKLKRLENLTLAFEKQMDIYNRSVVGVDVFENAYEKQIEDLISVKSAYPERVYPFFSIDPRREKQFETGVLGQIKKYVGKDKPFIGLKLYTSLGYSPTHPVLYDDSTRESVYGYCEKNQIPITIHASLEGFSHMLEENYVEGDIYYPPAGKAVPADHAFEGGIVKYEKGLPSMYFNDITSERLLTLNHPVIWRKVLEKYPNLILNMAHFGGIIQMNKLVKGNETGFWTQYIIDIMRDFPNVYTDLSCFYNHEEQADYLVHIYEEVYKKLPDNIKKRVLYGSDYYMIALYNTDLRNYYNDFKKAFSDDFIQISEINPKTFLGLE